MLAVAEGGLILGWLRNTLFHDGRQAIAERKALGDMMRDFRETLDRFE